MQVSATEEDGADSVKRCCACMCLEKNTVAVLKCLSCKEALCKTCSQIRHSCSLFADHVVTELVDAQTDSEKRETDLLTQYLFCSVHTDKLITYLCRDEYALCCIDCVIMQHRSCSEVTEITTFATKESNYTDAGKLKDKIAKVVAYSKSITETMKSNSAENKKEKSKILDSIQHMRRKINEVFDVMEEKIREHCNALTKKNSLTALDEIGKLTVISKELGNSLSLINKCISDNSPSTFYVLLKQLAKIITRCETEVLEVGYACKKHGFKLETDDVLKKMLEIEVNESDKLARLSEFEYDANVPEYLERKLLKYCSIKQTGVQKIIPTDSDLDWPPVYNALVFLPESRLFFVDYIYGFCSLVSDNFKMIASCNFMTQQTDQKQERRLPFCVTHVKAGLVAISVPNQKKICFLEASADLTVTGEVTTRYKPKALHCLKNGDMAVSWTGPVAFGMITLSLGYLIKEKEYFNRDTSGRILQSFEHMAVDEDRSHVVQCCWKTKTVYCFDFHGNPKFAYSCQELRKPCGITLDGDGNIYVCDGDSKSIHILATDGTSISIIVNLPGNPLAIGVRHDASEFLVTNSDRSNRQNIIVFQLC